MQQAAFRNTPTFVPGAGVPAGGIAAGLRRAPRALLDTLTAWQNQAEERAALLRLSDRELHDIGLSRGAAEYMARKRFWNR